MTTNVGIGAWAKVFGDPVVASAIADRLCHHCTVLENHREVSIPTKDLRAGPGTPETAPDVGGNGGDALARTRARLRWWNR